MKDRVTFEAFLKDYMSSAFAKIEKAGMEAFDKLDDQQEKLQRKQRQSSDGFESMGGAIKRLGAIAGGAAIGAAAMRWGQAIIETTSKFENFEAVLTNTLGSKGAARDSFSMIKAFASQTPFQVDEITDSFVRLANDGFKPTKDELTNLGDLAASRGKSFTQLSEALIDASVGEWERMKEFGVKAKQQGDQVSLTFKGQTTVIKNTAEAVRAYVLSLGKAQGVSGAMAKMSATTGGQISNLQDKITGMNYALGRKFEPITRAAIRTAGSMVDTLKDWAEVPMAQEIANEKAELNSLVNVITDANTSQELRNSLLDELEQKYPDFLEGINKETAANEELRKKLVDVNAEYDKKIRKASMAEIMSNYEQQYQQALSDMIVIEKQIKSKEFLNEGLFDVVSLINKNKVSKNQLGYTTTDEGFSAIAGKLSSISKKYYKGDKTYSDEEIKQIQTWLGYYDTLVNGEKWDDTETYKRWIDSKIGTTYSTSMDNLLAGKRSEVDIKRKLAQDYREEFNTYLKENPDPTDKEPPKGGLGGGTDNPDIMQGIVGDNRKVQNLTINIDKQIENIVFETSEGTMDMDIRHFTDKLKQALQNIVADAVEIGN